MMRQVSVNAGVIAALVMSLLAASGMPAGAASTSLQSAEYVVGSQHTTASELSQGTLTNLTTAGSGASGRVILDAGDGKDMYTGLESGDLSDWSGATNAFTVDNTRTHYGEYALHYPGGSGDNKILRSVPRGTPDTVSAWVNLETLGSAETRPRIQFRDTSAVLTSISADSSGTLNTYDGSGFVTHSGLTLSADAWYGIELTNIDYANNQYDLVLYDSSGSQVGSAQDVAFQDDVSAIDEFATTGSGVEYWVDDVARDEATAGQVPADATYRSGSHSVSNPAQAAVNITELSNVSVTAEVRTDGGTVLGSDTITSAGNQTVDVSSTSSSQIRTVLSIDITGSDPTLTLADESILFTNHAPQADNLSPPDGTQLDSSNVEFTADVSDAEFSTVQGDEVTAELFVDGESVGSETVTSNQTVSVNHELSNGGDHDYYWELTDSYGETTTTATQTVTVPATLEIRDVTDSSQLVDADNATVTFYGGEEEREIVERDASGGTVSLDGLPTDTEFTVVVRADDYYTRQTIIPSLYDQSNIWMLPRNDTDAVEIVFLLDDRTGDFANSDDTQLRVQRAIAHNNSTEWRDVVGDDISATAELATTLENQQRYRLVISNDVQTRILGSYTPSGPADPETIPIGRIDFQGDSQQGTAFDAALVNETQPGVQVMYRDPDTVADSLTYRVLNVTSENESVAVANTTISSPDAFTSVTEALPDGTTLEDSTYRVELWAHAEDGSLIEKRSATLGTISGPDFGDGVNNGILTLTGYLLLVGIGYGTGNYDPKLGILAAVIIGASLTIFNVVAIPHVVLGFTGTIALIVNAADRT